MGQRTYHGRHGANIEGDFVVFLIGMRINKPWKIHRWWPVFKAMPPMIRELSRDPDSGLLGVTKGMLGGGPALVQYWRSFEDLERFARNPDAHHLPAWRAFNQQIRASGDVGIWHETYRVRAGEYEAIYANMPRLGLAGAADHKPLKATSTAAQRLLSRPDDHAPVGGSSTHTSSERRVCRLAADGLSDRDIAQALFVTHANRRRASHAGVHEARHRAPRAARGRTAVPGAVEPQLRLACCGGLDGLDSPLSPSEKSRVAPRRRRGHDGA